MKIIKFVSISQQNYVFNTQYLLQPFFGIQILLFPLKDIRIKKNNNKNLFKEAYEVFKIYIKLWFFQVHTYKNHIPVHNNHFVYFFLINNFYLIIKFKERYCLFIALSKHSIEIVPV